MVSVGMFQQDGGIEEMIEMRDGNCNNVDDTSTMDGIWMSVEDFY